MTRVPLMGLAKEANQIARQLILEHHPHLLVAQILYVDTDQRRKRCDRVRLGSAAKLSSLQRFLASGFDGVAQGPDFIIMIDANEWAVLSKPAREALIDHELCHCALFVKDDTVRPAVWLRWIPGSEMKDPQEYAEQRWGMRGHDIEEFAAVLRRHGFWRTDPQEAEFQEMALQLVLPKGAVAGEVPTNGTAPAPAKKTRSR